jgi:MFS transporter, DHA3 family, macrolide efflux protein
MGGADVGLRRPQIGEDDQHIGQLQIWHLYVAGAFTSVSGAFQWPAYSAAISTLLKKEQYARANGMLSLAESLPAVFAAPLATTLLIVIGIEGILIFDVITFVFALLVLLFVSIPQPKVSAAGAAGRGKFVQEALYGLRFIWQNKPLLGVQLTFFAFNFLATLAFTVQAPMILARPAGGEAALAGVQSAVAIGGVIGAVILSAGGGPKRRILGVIGAMIAHALLSQVIFGVGQIVILWTIASFTRGLLMPVLNGSNQALWQAKVPPDIQGRVFAARRMIAQLIIPIGMAIAGPLADRVFEPAMQPDGALAPVFGGLVGIGPGAGMGLMFVIFSVGSALVAAAFFGVRAVREVDTRMPDHDAA